MGRAAKRTNSFQTRLGCINQQLNKMLGHNLPLQWTTLNVARQAVQTYAISAWKPLTQISTVECYFIRIFLL